MMASPLPFLSVLVPAYNEDANLKYCVETVFAKLDKWQIDAELLIVNDGSRDLTGQIADELAKTDRRVRVFHHLVKRGIGGGFLTGVSQAQGKWLILIPADLALDPDDICKYLAASTEADIVVGISSAREDYSSFRRLVSWTNIALIQRLFGMSQRQFNYISLYRLDVLRAINISYSRSSFFFAEILIKAKAQGTRLVEVDVQYAPRVAGKATGVRWELIARTMLDMLHFWLQQRHLQLD